MCSSCDDEDYRRLDEDLADAMSSNDYLTSQLTAAEERIEALSDLVKETADERDAAVEERDNLQDMVDEMIIAVEGMANAFDAAVEKKR